MRKYSFYFKELIFFILIIIIYIINPNNNKYRIKLNFINPNNTKNIINFLKTNDSLSEREKFFQFLSKSNGKKITRIKSIFLNYNARFGNMLIIIYKSLYFCKIIGCKKVILNKNKCWYIKNKIIFHKDKVAIDVNEKKNINNSNILMADSHFFFFYYNEIINPTYYINLFRGEIMNNLPNVVINKNDLCIYMRSGDIFNNPVSKNGQNRAQPPLCFFTKILNHITFRKVKIVCEDNKNPVIKHLLKLYSHVRYHKRDLKLDVSYLVNAINIAGGGYSTFFNGILLLNKNLENLWLFKYKIEPIRKKNNIETFFEKNGKFPYIMYSSKDFIRKMYPWLNSKVQRDLMINHICLNHFIYNNEAINY